MTFSHWQLFWTLFGTAFLGIATWNIFRMIFNITTERKLRQEATRHDERNRLTYLDKQDQRIERLERQMGLWLENQNSYKHKVVP